MWLGKLEKRWKKAVELGSRLNDPSLQTIPLFPLLDSAQVDREGQNSKGVSLARRPSLPAIPAPVEYQWVPALGFSRLVLKQRLRYRMALTYIAGLEV